MKFDFVDVAPEPEEVQAITIALVRFFAGSMAARDGRSTWRLAMQYPDASIDELRRQARSKWDVL